MSSSIQILGENSVTYFFPVRFQDGKTNNRPQAVVFVLAKVYKNDTVLYGCIMVALELQP